QKNYNTSTKKECSDEWAKKEFYFCNELSMCSYSQEMLDEQTKNVVDLLKTLRTHHIEIAVLFVMDLHPQKFEKGNLKMYLETPIDQYFQILTTAYDCYQYIIDDPSKDISKV